MYEIGIYLIMGSRSSMVKNIKKLLGIALILLHGMLFAGTAIGKKTFLLTDDPIDVVIPTIKGDLLTLNHCIEGIKKYGKSIRNVYVVSPTRLTDKAIWIDEKIFPFDIPSVAKHLFKSEQRAQAYLSKGKGRIGWYYQQLLKLYSILLIPGISRNVLLLDSDAIFLNPVSFMNENNGPLFCPASQYYKRYFEHGKKLIPGFERQFRSPHMNLAPDGPDQQDYSDETESYHTHLQKLLPNLPAVFRRHRPSYSGIAHHMLIQKDVIESLFELIERLHKKPAWQAICECVTLLGNHYKLPKSGFSEYEIYFNYFFATSNQGKIRHLKWNDISSIDNLNSYKAQGYHFIACHVYLRRRLQKKNKGK